MEVENMGELVLYKNNQLIAFNKPPAIAVQPDKTGDASFLKKAQNFCQSRLHLIHRIDRPTSGVVLFAKTENALADLNEQFKDRSVKKTYLAVVQNLPSPEEGELTHYIRKKNQMNRSHAFDKEVEGSKKGSLHYRKLASIDRYHLLEIDLKSGRHHQIRAQLAAIGCPIKGDVKYGFRRGNRDRSIHLHAWKLQFVHPVSKEEVSLCAPLPDDSVWQAFDF